MSSEHHSPPAVLVEGVSKRFRNPSERVHTLKERVLHPLKHTHFDDFVALDDVSFAVAPGEFFGLVGRNGSGKSTLLKCLAGIYRVDDGSIHVRGRLSTFIELGVGFNPDLAARDNVILNGIMLGLSPREARSRVDHVIAFAELEDFTELKLKNYSSGMQVRLAFSVMIQVDADVLLIDEVLAVGDASFQQKCFDVFHQMKDDGKTILFVTHDMAAVKRFCDRALLLEKGRVRLIDEPQRVGNHYVEVNFGRDGAGALDSEPGTERYGDQAAEIVEAWFENAAGQRTDVITQGASCRFCARLRFNKAVADPNAAVLIENDQHQPLFATSTLDAELATGSFGPGDEAIMSVGFEALLSTGRIYASPWVVHERSTNVMDRRPRMVSAVVVGTRNTGGVLDLPHDVRFGTGAPA
jgi:ABC-type polysaccharide/polyol phosphate transport system ATPase subunit